MTTITTTNYTETKNSAKSFLQDLKKNKSSSTIVALFGQLGAGKTTFVQGVAGALKIKENVISPTFVLMKKYKIPNNENFNNLIHIDAYRMDDERELFDVGWDEISNDKDNLIVIEWADKVESLLPAKIVKIKFSYNKENIREIKW